jgi:hypothetical protein
MHPHITICVPGAVLLAGLACMSCSDAAPPDATTPTSIRAIALSVQPEKVEPEFLPPFVGCTGARAFRTRFAVVVGGMETFVVQELRVSFSDRFGMTAVPTVVPATGAPSGSMITSSPPIPLPSSMPIPIPTSGPNDGLSVFPGGSRELPVLLEFGCHVRPQGTIVVAVGTRDGRGRSTTHRLTVDVGEDNR